MGSLVGVCETEMVLAHLFLFFCSLLITMNPLPSLPPESLSVGAGDVAKVITGLIIKSSCHKNFSSTTPTSPLPQEGVVVESSRGKMPPITKTPGWYHTFTYRAGLKMEPNPLLSDLQTLRYRKQAS